MSWMTALTDVICLTRKGTYSLNLFTESSAKDKVFLVIDIRIVVTFLWRMSNKASEQSPCFYLALAHGVASLVAQW